MCKRGKYKRMQLWVDIDECLVPLVKILNKYGIKTTGCCCGHGEMMDGKKANNNLLVLTQGAEFGIADEHGKGIGWQPASDFNVWAIAFPIEKEG